MKVLAAMSGGVDSAVAAARMVEAGHEVTGVHLALSKNPQSFRSGARGCCSIEDSGDARRAADMLDIPFYVWDLSDQFKEDVVDDFVAEYAAGRTPNPCLRCNEKIKFSAVLERAIALGFDAVCTGHYARLTSDADGTIAMYRAKDPEKDQSYVLGVLSQDQLRRSLFPLGDSLKSEVRTEAAARGLLVADKPDSHDICFIADGDTKGFLDKHLGTAPGEVVDTDGSVLGSHDGSHGFTIGQRRGLRLGVPAADGKPRYVLDISPVNNTVTVGPREALEVSRIDGIRPTWTGGAAGTFGHAGSTSGATFEPATSGSATSGSATSGSASSASTMVQFRAHGRPLPARVSVETFDGQSGIRVELAEQATGVAPGQAVVIYDGDRVIGSATISAAG